VPLLLQGAGHLGALQVATSLVLPAVLAAAAMAASSALTARIGARWTVVAGLLLVALATYLLHGVAPSAAGRLALLPCLRAPDLPPHRARHGRGRGVRRAGGAPPALRRTFGARLTRLLPISYRPLAPLLTSTPDPRRGTVQRSEAGGKRMSCDRTGAR